MKLLPTVTSAPVTDYVHESIRVGIGNHKLTIDGNSKITAGNGTFAVPRPNAFSLRHIDDCPHSTATCRAGCYVHGLQAETPALYAEYVGNAATIRQVLDGDLANRVTAIADFGEWIAANCTGGFRWHVSGDVFSRAYANLISLVCVMSQDVQHWIYTRSFLYVDWLDASNLAVNLSADQDNYPAARECHLRTGHRLTYFTDDGLVPDDLPDGSVIFPDYSLRGVTGRFWHSLPGRERRMICPVDMFGKSENIRCGVCTKCM